MDPVTEKRCTKCKIVKPRTDFGISPRTGNPYPRCKSCRAFQKTIHRKYTQKVYDWNAPNQWRHCAECQLAFLPNYLYQKTCSPACEALWNQHRQILRAAEVCRISIDGHIMLLDADDYRWARLYEWNILKNPTQNGDILYPYRRTMFHGQSIEIKISNEIMEPPDGLIVDHINHSGLDNRKDNLRICTHQQNTQNVRKAPGKISCYKGVSWHREAKKWRAYIAYDARYHHLGFFEDEIKAALAYDKAAQEQYGEFAWLNFPLPEMSLTEANQ